MSEIEIETTNDATYNEIDIKKVRDQAIGKFKEGHFKEATDLLLPIVEKRFEDDVEEWININILCAKSLIEEFRSRIDPIDDFSQMVSENLANSEMMEALRANMDVMGDSESELEDEENESEEDSFDENDNSEGNDQKSNQLAKDLLETANKEILGKQLCEEKDFYRLSEIHLYLGLLHTENEKWEDATKEYEKCVLQLNKISEMHCRVLAEVYFYMGLNFEYMESYPDAEKHFKLAASELKKQIEHLETLKSQNSDGKVEKEIKEVNEIIIDVENKINDCVESLKLNKEEIKQEIMNVLGMGGKANSSEKNPPEALFGVENETDDILASDINHLVRKKAKIVTNANGTNSQIINKENGCQLNGSEKLSVDSTVIKKDTSNGNDQFSPSTDSPHD